MHRLLLPLVCVLFANPAAAQSFEILPSPDNASLTYATAISPDGKTIFLRADNTPYAWRDGETTALPFGSGVGGNVVASTPDGSIAVGSLQRSDGYSNAAIWTNGELRVVTIPFSPTSASFNGISADGSTLSGTGIYTLDPAERWQAFRYVDSTATVAPLGFLSGDVFSESAGISADGSIIAGGSHETRFEIYDAFYWDGSMHAIPKIEPNAEMYTQAMSSNGRYVAGGSYGLQRQAWRYEIGSGLVPIPFVEGAGVQSPTVVLNDGTVFGTWYARIGTDRGVFIWNPTDGLRKIESLITELGLSTSGLQLREVTGATPDGSVITGDGWNGSANVAFRLVVTPAEEIVVNSTDDDSDFNLDDEICDADQSASGEQCTLRAAIETANADGTGKRITFDIPGTGTHTIAVSSPLPEPGENIKIDGTTQPGYDKKPVVVLDGSGAGTATDGLTLSGSGSGVSGLAIDNFGGNGIRVTGASVLITRMHIGTENGVGKSGILAEGSFDNLTVGSESDASLGNTIGNTGGDGIYLKGPDNAALGKNAHALINIRISNNLIGALIGPQNTPTALQILQNGIRMLNIQGGLFSFNTIVNSRENGFDISGAGTTQNTFTGNDVGGWFMRTGNSLDKVVAMGNQMNGFMLHPGPFGNLFGFLGKRPNTVVGNSHYGFRLTGSNNNDISGNLIGVPADSLENVPEKNGSPMINIGNVLGGLCIEDSEGNVIGKPGLGNIISNNGSTQDHAGIILKGVLTKLNLIQSNHIGTNPLGHLIGNLGSGVLVTEGADENTIGGDSEPFGNIIGANSGNGIYLKGPALEQTTSDAVAKTVAASAINFGNVSHNLIGAMMVGNVPKNIGNLLNGICMINAAKTIASLNTIAGNMKNGVEVAGPLSVDNLFQANRIGAIGMWASLSDQSQVTAFPNLENGYLMRQLVLRNIIKGLFGQKSIVLSNRKYGFLLDGARETQVLESNVGNLGDVPTGPNGKNSEMINFGNALGALCVRNSTNTLIGLPGLGNILSGNGTDSTNAAVTLLGNLTKGTKMLANMIGTTLNGSEAVPNTGPGIKIDGASETEIGDGTEDGQNVVSGNLSDAIQAIESSLTKINGNIFGRKPGSLLPFPNVGAMLKLQSDKLTTVERNNIFSEIQSAIDGLNSFNFKLSGNRVEQASEIPMPAIRLRGADGAVIGARAQTSTDVATGSEGNEIIAHEAVHVVQGNRVQVTDNSVTAPDGPDQAEDVPAILLEGVTNAQIGDATRGNTMTLRGGTGARFVDSQVDVVQLSIQQAQLGLDLQQTQMIAEMIQLDAAKSARLRNKTIADFRTSTFSVTQNGTVIDSDDSELRATGNNVEITNNKQAGKGSAQRAAGDLFVLTGTNAVINGNNIPATSGYGVFNANATGTVDATGNWWGDESGPSGEGPGSGASVSTFVEFSGWLNAPVGLVLSTPRDNISVIPGESAVVQAQIRNLLDASDTADLTVADESAWVTSATNFSLPAGLTPTPFDVDLSVPADASGSNSITISAVSQNDPQLDAELVVVANPVAPTASVNISASQNTVSLSAPNVNVNVTANPAAAAFNINLYNASSLSTNPEITDDRVTSPNNSTVRPAAVSDSSWVVRTTPTAGKRSTVANPSGNQLSDGLIFDACFAVEGNENLITDPDLAVVVTKQSARDPWRAVASTREAINEGVFLCARDLDAFGYFALAAGIESTPSPPVVSFPQRGREGVASDPTFVWEQRAGANSYQVEISTDSLFRWVDFNGESQSRYFTPTGLWTSTTFYWRIRSGSDLGYGPWSETSNFRTSDTGVAVEEAAELPVAVQLDPNYPNPFSDRTTIVYRLPESDHVRLEVFDLQGRLVDRIVDGQESSGEHSVQFDGSRHASGVYFYRLRTTKSVETRRMIVVK